MSDISSPSTTTPTAKPTVQYQLNSTLTQLTNSNNIIQHTTTLQNYSNEQRCPNCGSTDIIEDIHHGNNVCSACGIVISQLIDTGSEWRTFQDDGQAGKGVDGNRIGGIENSLLSDMGLSTVIGRSDHPNSLARTHINSTVDIKHKYLLLGFEKCQSIGNTLELNKSIIDRSKETFKRSVDANAFKPKLIDSVITACIFISCKQENVQRTFKELCSVVHVQQRDVGRCFQKLRQLKLHKRVDTNGELIHDGTHNDSNQLLIQNAIDTMLSRFCSLLTLPPNITRVTQYICKRAIALDLIHGRQQASIAGGAIYLATQLKSIEYKRDYQKIAQVTYMSAATIKSAYASLYANRHQLIPDNYVSKDVLDSLKLNQSDTA